MPVWPMLRMAQSAARARTVPLASAAGLGGALLFGAIGYQALVRYGRVLARLAVLEAELDRLVGWSGNALGLPAGRTIIEDFELPELRGGRVSHSQWRGSTLLLVFFDPTSAACHQLVPGLAALTTKLGAHQPLPVIVSTGDREINQRVFQPHGVECPVLLQDEWEVGELFQVRITPMAYLIDEYGLIAAPPAVGVPAILALGLTGATPGTDALSQAAGPLATDAPTTTYPTHVGLDVGVMAPEVRVPLLRGGEFSLASYRGERVLLIFWDPLFGPCLPLATHLEAIHRRSSGPAILVISRGSEQVNREAADELDLTFPIGLQQHWEVSREFAMFATPVAYLIDEDGVIAHDVVIGADAILRLASNQCVEQAGGAHA